MEKAKKFFDILNTDPKAQELLQDCAKPEKPEDVLKAYVDIAGKLGISLTEEDIKNHMEEEKAAVKSRTESAVSQIEELPDDALDAVAGGKGERSDCKNTYKDKENCWFNDGCDNVYHLYDDYLCAWYYYLKGEK